MVTNKEIDQGREFDWGKASSDYARYRDIYPAEFYQKILSLGFCAPGRRVLDLGTGTGVLPRNLYGSGASFTGADLSPDQIAQARRLAREEGMEISFVVSGAEQLDFPDNSFDEITACQCFFYFDPSVFLPLASRILRPGGTLGIFYMAWLPEEDPIAGASEELIHRYNPLWTGGGETRHPISLPEQMQEYFEREESLVFDLRVPFTRESWNGRIRACRGIGASLPEEEVARFEREHRALLDRIAPEQFEVLHYAAMEKLRVKKDWTQE